MNLLFNSVPDGRVLSSVNLEDCDSADAELFGEEKLILDGAGVAPPHHPEWGILRCCRRSGG